MEVKEQDLFIITFEYLAVEIIKEEKEQKEVDTITFKYQIHQHKVSQII